MSQSWSKGRIAFLVIGVICVAIGLVMIIPALGN
jgi:uncharacterized membrane protein